MARLLLHIGTAKTGSTSIQHWMKGNQENMATSSVATLRSLGWPNAIKLAAASSGFTGPTPLHTRRGITDSASWEDFRKRVRGEAAHEIRSLGRKVGTIVISNEHLSTRLKTQSDVDRLHSFFDGLVDSCEILVYLRRQDRMARSRHGTAILAGSTNTDPFRLPAPGSSIYFYDELLERYANAFSKSSVNARIYDRVITADGGVIGDFLQVLGVDYQVESREPRANRSIDPAILELIRQVNERGPVSRSARRSLQMVAKTFTAAPTRASPGAAERFLEYFSSSNERLRQEWFPELEAVFPGASAVDSGPTSPRSESDPNEPNESSTALLADFVARLAERSSGS